MLYYNTRKEKNSRETTFEKRNIDTEKKGICKKLERVQKNLNPFAVIKHLK